MTMNKLVCLFSLVCLSATVWGQTASISSPDNQLKVDINVQQGKAYYAVSYRGKSILENSPLGFVANTGDFSQALSLIDSKADKIIDTYQMDRIKKSVIRYEANELILKLENDRQQHFNIVFRVSNNDVAFRYTLPRNGETGSIIIKKETTGFDFPQATTTFLIPQSDAMIGWKRTKPSYEEEYNADAPLTAPSKYGHGYTFPALFRIGNNGWALVSETGVDSHYCASRLSEASSEGCFTIEFPMEEENNGNGTVAPAFALPGNTPWRTITIGDNLKPIVETTIPWNVVHPLYEASTPYQFGKGTWSWILWQDGSINYDDQVRFIDLAAAMGFQYTLIDNWWDTNIGHQRMADLSKYAQRKNVNLFIWYSSSGYWNDIVQGPINVMDNPISRKKEMKWLKEIGAKGIKVDFFGGDKQETMRLYEAILSDANDYGLMVIFHGCTIPRGWERMYPNYVGSEAVLASENLVFNQHFDDMEAFNATLHPFIRNTIGSMEFGGTILNKRLNKGNDGGKIRRTTDVFQIATAVLFQNPIQNFALAPNNLTDAPTDLLDFLRRVPTTWDDIQFIDGYPGKYCVLARRHNDTWYIAGINAQDKAIQMNLNLPMLDEGATYTYYYDSPNGARSATMKMKKRGSLKLNIQPNGGFVIVCNR